MRSCWSGQTAEIHSACCIPRTDKLLACTPLRREPERSTACDSHRWRSPVAPHTSVTGVLSFVLDGVRSALHYFHEWVNFSASFPFCRFAAGGRCGSGGPDADRVVADRPLSPM